MYRLLKIVAFIYLLMVVPLTSISQSSDPNAPSNSLNETYTNAQSLVEAILQTMEDGNSVNTKLRKYIAPSYYTKYNLDKNAYYIDNYTINGFEVKSYDDYNKLVVAHIWGENKTWVHELTFKIVEEYGSFYVYPEKHSSSYIKPWYKSNPYITKKNSFQ